MNAVRYLAYGSNLLPARLQARIGAVDALAAVRLQGWAIDFSKRGADGSGKCTLNRVASGCAYGVIYAICAETVATLDHIEGVGHGYATAWLDLPDYDQCYVYLAEEHHRDSRLQPFDWYKALVLSGARHHGFPDEYIEALEAVTAIIDPDAERRALNLHIVAAGG
jgi:gamma-glutamylcyclotransferase